MGNPVYQQNSSHPQLVHSTASYPGGQFVNQNAAGLPAYGSPNLTMQQNNNNNLGNSLMSSAVQGLVEGAFQAVGQTVMQDVLASSDGGAGGANDGGAYDESA